MFIVLLWNELTTNSVFIRILADLDRLIVRQFFLLGFVTESEQIQCSLNWSFRMTQEKCNLFETCRVGAQLGCTLNKHTDCIRSHQRIERAFVRRTKKDNNTRAQSTHKSFEPFIAFPFAVHTVVSFESTFRSQCIVVREFTMHCCLSGCFILQYFQFYFVSFYNFVSFDRIALMCLRHLAHSVVHRAVVALEYVSVVAFGWCSFCVCFTSFFLPIFVVVLFGLPFMFSFVWFAFRKVLLYCSIYICFSNNWAEKRNRSLFFPLLCVK